MIQSTDWAKVIESLAAKLSVPAAQLWEVLVRQARIDTIEASIWLVIAVTTLILLTTVGQRRMRAYIDKAQDSYSASDRRLACVIPSVIVGVAAIAIFADTLPVVLRGIFNPQFGALKYLLDAAK